MKGIDRLGVLAAMVLTVIALLLLCACSVVQGRAPILGDDEILYVERCDSAVVYGASGDAVPADRLNGRYAFSPQETAKLMERAK